MIQVLSTLNSTIAPAPVLPIRYAAAIMGQSNMDGRVPLAQLPVDITNPSNIVKVWDSGWSDWQAGTIPVNEAVNGDFGWDTLMLNRLAVTLNKTLYGIKESEGGTSFQASDNIKGDWNISSTAPEDHFLSFRQKILDAKNYALNVEGRRLVVPYMLMDIGETDCSIGTKQGFKDSARDFINAIKDIVGNPDLPIIWRELFIEQTYVNQDGVDVQNELAAEIDSLTLIPSTGLDTFDGVHLDLASLEIIESQVRTLVEPLYI